MSRTDPRDVCPHVLDDQVPYDLQHFIPARRVVSRTTKRVVGRFPSSKRQAMISWESQLERDFLYLLETDRDVADFVEQPERLHLVIDGDTHSYVPDFLVWGHHGQSWMVEVKADDEAEHPENRALFSAAAEACLHQNMGFRLVLGSWIRREPRLSNAKLLVRYTKVDPAIEVTIRATALLAEGSRPLGSLREELGGYERYQEVMALLLKGHIAVDLDRPLTSDSLVWLPQEGNCP